jgi:translocation and assembly module TamA
LIHLRTREFERWRQLPRAYGAALALALLLLGALAVAAEPPPGRTAYDVRIEGVEDAALRDLLTQSSELVALKESGALGPRALRRRAEDDVTRLTEALRARGYYDGTVAFEVETSAKGPTAVVLKVVPGRPYRLRAYSLRSVVPSEPKQPIVIGFKALGLELGEIGTSEKIVRSETALKDALGRKAHPLATIAERKVVVDHATQGIDVEIAVDPGPAAVFGPTVFTGLADVEPAYVRREIAWKEGMPFDISLIAKTRQTLRRSGLFDSVSIDYPHKVDAHGALPVTVKLTERKPRSVGAGISYSTTDGALAKIFWQHRNLFGQGEQLNLRGEAGEIRLGGFANLRVLDAFRRDQDLVLDLHATQDTPEGYRAFETAGSAKLERRFADIYSVSGGLGFERSIVEQSGVERSFTLVSVPLALKRDSSDNVLDPHRGGRLAVTLTPYRGVLNTKVDFVSGVIADSIYVPLDRDEKMIFAGWARFGTIVGATTPAIPANKRLYAGGGGSVRGYGLNSIGPLDAATNPIGGRSSTEFGGELRWRAFEDFGFAAFLEAGEVYDTAMPDWGRGLRWGAGLGVRYYTSIGPLRLDVAVPLNRRNGVDDPFVILVSLGQAF